MSELPPSAKSRLFDALGQMPSETRQAFVRRQTRTALGFAALFLGVSLMHGPRAWLLKPLVYQLALLAGLGATAAWASGVVAGFARRLGGPVRGRVRRVGRLALPLLALSALLANALAPETLGLPDPRLSRHLVCPLVVVGIGVLMVVLATRSLGRVDPLTPRDSALALGASCGAWAALAVGLECHFADPLHVLATHVLPVLVVMLFAGRYASGRLGIN